jgi:hypothetical protein
MPSCGFCGRPIPTIGGVLRHIQATVTCREARKLQIKSYHINILDLEDDQDIDNTPSNAQDDGDNSNVDNVDFDPSSFLEGTPEPSPSPSPEPESRHARVEDADDEDDDLTGSTRYVNPYPYLAGTAKGQADPKFEHIRKEQMEQGEDIWAPFEDQDEWELARWLARNVGQKQTDDFLKLPIVCDILLLVHHFLNGGLQIQKRTQTSYHNKRSFLEQIDQLPTQGAKWICDIVTAAGDRLNDVGIGDPR